MKPSIVYHEHILLPVRDRCVSQEKRVFDILFALTALSVFLLPMILIALLLVVKERHSILFIQLRLGAHRQPFRILKFQTMVNGIPTWTGKVLRSTGLDEIPQFINVLKGEMSIVGPRALTEADVIRLGWNDRFHRCRWECAPGITGLAQIFGGQHKKISWFWDSYYRSRNTLAMDLGVIGISFLMNLFGKDRVRRIMIQWLRGHRR